MHAGHAVRGERPGDRDWHHRPLRTEPRTGATGTGSPDVRGRRHYRVRRKAGVPDGVGGARREVARHRSRAGSGRSAATGAGPSCTWASRSGARPPCAFAPSPGAMRAWPRTSSGRARKARTRSGSRSCAATPERTGRAATPWPSIPRRAPFRNGSCSTRRAIYPSCGGSCGARRTPPIERRPHRSSATRPTSRRWSTTSCTG